MSKSENQTTAKANCPEWPHCGCGGLPCKRQPNLKVDRDRLFDRIKRDAESGFDGNEGAGISRTTRRPVDQIGASGPVNGMHETDRGGAYVKIVAIHKDGERHVFAISRGAAEVLMHEISAIVKVLP